MAFILHVSCLNYNEICSSHIDILLLLSQIANPTTVIET